MVSGQNISDMEQSTIKSPTSPIQRSTCEQQAYAKSQIERMIRIQSYKLAIVEDLKKYPDYEEDHFYQNALMELQDIENFMQLAILMNFNFPGRPPKDPFLINHQLVVCKSLRINIRRSLTARKKIQIPVRLSLPPLASPRRHWPLAPPQQDLMRHNHRTLCHHM
ncbi:hypothetical protein TNCT_270921 [Trichonephila clavata]|uniref:Uncharacterized protein n=1 Tax=Trichonephila clavata TaxID=2740835 RepID=A0A8X6IEW1_TRICU|nr:hypothetical protein TNCT_270921 [Trichonephila clavata]